MPDLITSLTILIYCLIVLAIQKICLGLFFTLGLFLQAHTAITREKSID